MQNEYESENNFVLERTCPNCKQTKPLKAFRYKLTRKQAQQQGYAGNVLVTAEGKVCKECRPKRKPLGKLTNKELMNKAASGDVPAAVAKTRIAQNKKDANLLRKRARAERWVELWADEWQPLWDGLQRDIANANGRASYSRKRKQTDRVEFFVAYAKELAKVLAATKHAFRQKPRRPEYTHWQEYVPEHVSAALRAQWGALPLEVRMNYKSIPTMVSYRYAPEERKYTKSPANEALKARIAWLAKNNQHLPFINQPTEIPREFFLRPHKTEERPYPKPSERLMPHKDLPDRALPPIPDDIEKWLEI